MQIKGKLSVADVVYFIVHKPSVIVRFENSQHNRDIISLALDQLAMCDRGSVIFEGFRHFLQHVAPKQDLDASQEGVRRYMVREVDRILGPPAEQPGKSHWWTAFFGFRTT